VTRSFDAQALAELARSLLQPGAAAELGVLALCLAVAWGVVRVVQGRVSTVDSVWLGKRIVDGVLFPVLALALAYAARLGLEGMIRPAVFRVAIPVLLSLVVIRLAARVLERAFPNVGWVRAVERSVSWLAWIGVILWLTGIGPMLLDAMGDVELKIGSANVTLLAIVEGVLLTAIVLVLALWVSAALERRLLTSATGDNLSLRKMVATVLRTLLLFVSLLFALSAAGIDLTALSVLGGAVVVGLGFGLQRIAANYVSGFVLLAERSVRIGDMIKVDGFEGRVTDIRTRYTMIRSPAGREAIVPNETMITTRVENASVLDSRVCLRTAVQVAYGTDVRALQGRLQAAVAGVPRVVADPPPAMQLDAFAADGMNLAILFWIRDSENGENNVRSEVNFAVLDALNAAGVEIPFPQRVVHAVASSERPATREGDGRVPPG
jgi:small-conductance mechanosensitive channel